MVTIAVDYGCSCLSNSSYHGIEEYSTESEAIQRANQLLKEMRETFCGTHRFSIERKSNNEIIIHSEEAF